MADEFVNDVGLLIPILVSLIIWVTVRTSLLPKVPSVITIVEPKSSSERNFVPVPYRLYCTESLSYISPAIPLFTLIVPDL